MNKRKLNRVTDNEGKLARKGKDVRALIKTVNDALASAHLPMDQLTATKDRGSWGSFILPGNFTGDVFEFKDFDEFVTHENGLNLDPDVYEWLMSCPVEKIDTKGVTRRRVMFRYS